MQQQQQQQQQEDAAFGERIREVIGQFSSQGKGLTQSQMMQVLQALAEQQEQQPPPAPRNPSLPQNRSSLPNPSQAQAIQQQLGVAKGMAGRQLSGCQVEDLRGLRPSPAASRAHSDPQVQLPDNWAAAPPTPTQQQQVQQQQQPQLPQLPEELRASLLAQQLQALQVAQQGLQAPQTSQAPHRPYARSSQSAPGNQFIPMPRPSMKLLASMQQQQQQQQLQSMRTPHSLLNELLGAGVSSHSSGSLQQQSAHGLLNRLLDGGADKCGVASTPQLPNHLPYSLLQPKGPQGVPGDSSGSGKTVHGLGDDCIKTNNGAAAGPAPHHSIAGRNNAASVSSALRDSMFPSPATPAASHASAGGSSDSGGSGGIHTAAEAAPACPPFQQNQQQQDALAQALRAILGSCPLTSDALLHPGAAPPASLPPLQLPSLAAIPPLTSQAPPPSQASAAPRGQHVAAPAAPASSPPLSASLAAPSPLPSHATTSTPCALQKPQRGVPQAGNTGEQGALASAHECAPAHADQPLPQQQQQVPITLNSAAGAAEATGNPAAKRSSQTQQQQQQQHLPPAPAGGAAAAAASSSTLSCGLAMGEPPVVAAAHGI
uniref:Uncharacterized protein n=1 Tax=Dunaliella tertiolecta TaxID=3047 RepID=A0A7S3QZJ3_DUNTE